MIKVEPCKGCGGVILVDDFMGVRIRVDALPLDAQTAGAALLAGLTLYRVHYLGGRPSSFGSVSPTVLGGLRAEPSERPVVVVQHRCATAARRSPQSAPKVKRDVVDPKEPQSPPVGPGTAIWAPPTESPNANGVGRPLTDPTCDGCGEPCEQGTYASIELGDLIQWCHHVEACGGK